jgi:hypothetical protein
MCSCVGLEVLSYPKSGTLYDFRDLERRFSLQCDQVQSIDLIKYIQYHIYTGGEAVYSIFGHLYLY